MKKVGILGSGQVAKTLGTGFINKGYEVKLGSRNKNKLIDWQKSAGANAHIGSFEEAAMYGEIVVLAVLGRAAEEVLHMAGIDNLDGKVVIDTTNPISEALPEDGVLKFFTGSNESLMEQLQERFPALHFVKAFNSVGSTFMVDPEFKDGKPTMFICGNNDDARKVVSQILDEFGWEVADMGKAAAARPIEQLCILWCIPGFLQGKWSHAFKLLQA